MVQLWFSFLWHGFLWLSFGSALVQLWFSCVWPCPRHLSTPTSGACSSGFADREQLGDRTSQQPCGLRHSRTHRPPVVAFRVCCGSCLERTCPEPVTREGELRPYSSTATAGACSSALAKAAAWRENGSAARRIEAMPWALKHTGLE